LARLFKLSALYAVADMASRGSALLLVPLYAHFMAPDGYGILALASLVTSLLVMLLSFGGQSVVQRFYNQFADDTGRAQFLGAFWLFLLTVPGAVLAVVWLCGQEVVRWLMPSFAAQPYLQLVLGISYLNVAFGTVLPGLFRARDQGWRYLALSLATMVTTVAFSVYFLVVLQLGAVGALGGQLAGALLMAVVSLPVLMRQLAPAWRWGELRRALKFGLPLVPHFAAHWTLSISDRAIVGAYAGLGGVGLYSMAYQFGTLLQMLLSSINSALMPVFSRAAKDERELAALPRLTTYYCCVVAALGLATALVARDVILIATPVAYHSAGSLVPFISLGIVAMGFYFVPMNALSMTAGRTSVIPVITTIAGATNLGLNLLAVPVFGPVAAAINTAVGYTLLALLTTLYTRRVVTLHYETTRLCKLALVTLALFGIGQLVEFGHPAVDLFVRMLVVAALPFGLWLVGFWSRHERAVVAHLIGSFAARFRTNRRGD
jgi:O-antigen/teichoic acid export membrane protein